MKTALGTIHFSVCSVVGNATITDMANAGKRGKRCRRLFVRGSPRYWLTSGTAGEPDRLASEYTAFLMDNFGDSGLKEGSFDVCRDAILDVVSKARAEGVPEDYLAVFDEEIRGVDAPQPRLMAGVAGKWSARADESGIVLKELNDVNEWTELTPSSQSGAAAYAVAKKVWKQVEVAATLHEAATILRQAGARLHGFCGLD